MRYVRPKREHEDNIKTQLYRWASKSNMHLHFEYRHKDCRFDAVFTREGEILAIIEVKNWKPAQALKAKMKPTEQLKRYMSFGPPVYVLWSFKGIRGLVAALKKIAGDFDDTRRLPKAVLRFYPKPKKITREQELAAVIKQQEKDMKYGDKVRSWQRR